MAILLKKIAKILFVWLVGCRAFADIPSKLEDPFFKQLVGISETVSTGMCTNNDALLGMDRVYAKNSHKYNEWDSEKVKGWRKSSLRRRFSAYNGLEDYRRVAKKKMLQHARMSLVKKLFASRQALGMLSSLRRKAPSPVMQGCGKLAPRFQREFNQLVRDDDDFHFNVSRPLAKLPMLEHAYKGLAVQSYVQAVLEELLISGKWKHEDFLPLGVEQPDFAFPPVVPNHIGDEDRDNKEIRRDFPKKSLEELLQSAPILRRLDKKLPGIPLSHFGNRVFLAEYIHPTVLMKKFERTGAKALGRFNKVYEQLKFDVQPVIMELYQKLIKDQVLQDNMELPPAGSYFEMTKEQRTLVLAWEVFLEVELPKLITKKLVNRAQSTGSLIPNGDVLSSLARVADKWESELTWGVTEICEMSDSRLQDVPGIAAIHFSSLSEELSTDAEEFYFQLEGYCRTPWRSNRRNVEDTLKMATVPAIVAATVVPGGQPIAAALTLGAAALAGTNFIVKSAGGVLEAQLASALYNPSISERFSKNGLNFYNAAMAAFSSIYVLKITKVARQALHINGHFNAKAAFKFVNFLSWRPSKKIVLLGSHILGNATAWYRYHRQGENAFKRREYVVGAISGTIGMFALSPAYSQNLAGFYQQFKMVLYFFGTQVIVDEAYQGSLSMLTGEKQDPRVTLFNLTYSGVDFFDKMIWVSFVNRYVGFLSPPIHPLQKPIMDGLLAVLTAAKVYTMSNWSASSRLRYFDDPKYSNPLSALINPTWDDISPTSKTLSPNLIKPGSAADLFLWPKNKLTPEEMEKLGKVGEYLAAILPTEGIEEELRQNKEFADELVSSLELQLEGR